MDFHEAANLFPLEEETIPELAEHIRKNGQSNPIKLFKGEILDGRRRFRACELAGITPSFEDVTSRVSDPIAFVLGEGMLCRQLSPTQKAMVGARAREMYDRQAKERQKEAGKVHGRGKKQVPANLPEAIPPAGDARDTVGKAVGVSGKTIDAATKVLEHGTPKLIAAVDADQIAVSAAAKVISRPAEEQDSLADRAMDTANKGHRARPRPTEATEEDAPIPDPDTDPEARQVRGKGLILAEEAINSLIRIPKHDVFRKRGFQLVTDWIKRNP